MGKLLVVLALVAAACGGSTTTSATSETSLSTSEPATAVASSPPEESVNEAQAEADAIVETAPAARQTSRTKPEGRDAPEFTLALGQGGEFTLSGEAKPVYMVFWAEW